MALGHSNMLYTGSDSAAYSTLVAALMGCHARHKAALATTIYAEAGSSSDGEVEEEATDPVTVRRARARRVGSSQEKRGQCV